MSRFAVHGSRNGFVMPSKWVLGMGTLMAFGTACFPHAAGAQRPDSKYAAADVAFVQGMIGHHAQALQMTALIPSSTQDQTMRLLGERITVSQRDEIAMMAEWLRIRGEKVPPIAAAVATGAVPSAAMDHGQMDHMAMGTAEPLMPGMLSSAQMDSLRAARRVAFDRLFLRYMIQHHEGALVMVKQLMSSPGAAQEPQLFGFASDVDTDQRAEIRRMQALLTSKFRRITPARP